MIAQNIKALLLFISFCLFVIAAGEWHYDTQSYLGFVGSAFLALWAVNAVDLYGRWFIEKRKVDLTDEMLPQNLRRQTDIFKER